MSTVRPFKRGQYSMSMREVVSASEWQTLQFAPLWMFSAVAGADGEFDNNEFNALVKEVAEAPLFKEPLVREVLFSIGMDVDATMRAYRADRRSIDEGLSAVADILDEYATPEQSANFKSALMMIGKNIAEASGGGFLGLGNKISDREKRALFVAFVALRIANT